MDRLYQILEYGMNHQEALAFKIGLIWEDLTSKYFPGVRCGSLGKGDPRKSSLFKHCYKLARETKGLIPVDQYEYYVQAQLDLLRSIQNREKFCVNISPSCLIGKKAWARWKVWLKQYKSLEKVHIVEITALESKIEAKFKKTREFLLKQFNKYPSVDDLRRAIKSRTFARWVTLGVVCGHYAVLSPKVREALDGRDFEKEFLFDLSIYKTQITERLEELFKVVFPEEYD